MRALETRGYPVLLVDPDETIVRVTDGSWMDGLDVVVARGRSWQLLALLGWAERTGMPTVNRRDAVARVLNKAEMSMELAHAGIPTPQTFVAAVDSLARDISEDHYPLVIKPVFGDNSRGLRVVNTPRELSAIKWPDRLAIAQPYVSSDGYDLKLYGIGKRVFAVRKATPLSVDPQRERGQPQLVPATTDLEKLARACMELFGLELYGVDCIETPNGPVVIEVNDFPNYSGVPGSDQLLADHVIFRAKDWSWS
jgi:ribosomal protein S6--L-glutamate ligase